MKTRKLITMGVVFIIVTTIFSMSGFQQSVQASSDAPTITLKTLNWFPMDYMSASILKGQLEKIGLHIELIEEDGSSLYPEVYEKHDFELYLNAWSNSPFPSNIFSFWQSWNDYPNGNNIYGFHNATIDVITNETQYTGDYKKFIEGVYKIEEIVAENVVVIPLFLDINTQLVNSKWTGYVPMPGGEFTYYNIWTYLNLTPPASSDGTFVLAYPSDIQKLNYFNTNNLRDESLILLIYDTLVKFNPQMKIVPYLATDYSVSKDGLTYTFHIHKNVKFHDGEPLTAKDVAFTYEWALKNKAPYIWPYINMISSITTPDNYTVVFHLSKPYIGLLYAMATIPIVPKHIWEGKTLLWDNPHPIGSGPFIWESRTPGSKIVLVRNPNYWYKVPKIKKLVITIVKDQSVRIMDIEKGIVHAELYSTPPNLAINATKAAPDMVKIIESPGLWSVWLMFNLRKKPTNDIWLRKAIAYAINKQEYIEKVLYGYGHVEDCIVTPEWSPGLVNPNLTKYEYNPEKAKEILQEHGYISSSGGEANIGLIIGISVVVIAIIAAVAVYYVQKRKKESK